MEESPLVPAARAALEQIKATPAQRQSLGRLIDYTEHLEHFLLCRCRELEDLHARLQQGDRALTTLRVTDYGTVEEANAAIAVARLHTQTVADAMLGRIQNDRFELGADLYQPGDDADDQTAPNSRHRRA